jgi:hypothetical protein
VQHLPSHEHHNSSNNNNQEEQEQEEQELNEDHNNRSSNNNSNSLLQVQYQHYKKQQVLLWLAADECSRLHPIASLDLWQKLTMQPRRDEKQASGQLASWRLVRSRHKQQALQQRVDIRTQHYTRRWTTNDGAQQRSTRTLDATVTEGGKARDSTKLCHCGSSKSFFVFNFILNRQASSEYAR